MKFGLQVLSSLNRFKKNISKIEFSVSILPISTNCHNMSRGWGGGGRMLVVSLRYFQKSLKIAIFALRSLCSFNFHEKYYPWCVRGFLPY